MEITLHAFSGLTGAHITRLDYIDLSWSDAINEEGSITATIVCGDLEIASICKPYGTIIAAISGNKVLHAGYVYHLATTDEDNHGLCTVDAGGGLTVLEKRLVLNYNLNASWKNGTVVVDEKNPVGNWLFSIKGTYSDIVSRLISETKKWGSLPINPSTIQGGSSHERNYNSYDLNTVLDAIQDLTELSDGPEVRLDPQLSNNWVLSFSQKTGDEIIDTKWKLNSLIPDSGVFLESKDASGDDICTQCYALGGKDEDKLLVCRSVSTKLTANGWPVLQIANKRHTSVSVLSTLQSYSQSDVINGDSAQITYGLLVDRDKYDIHVGDWIDLRCESGVLTLKVVGISGDATKQFNTIECKERQ